MTALTRALGWFLAPPADAPTAATASHRFAPSADPPSPVTASHGSTVRRPTAGTHRVTRLPPRPPATDRRHPPRHTASSRRPATIAGTHRVTRRPRAARRRAVDGRRFFTASSRPRRARRHPPRHTASSRRAKRPRPARGPCGHVGGGARPARRGRAGRGGARARAALRVPGEGGRGRARWSAARGRSKCRAKQATPTDAPNEQYVVLSSTGSVWCCSRSYCMILERCQRHDQELSLQHEEHLRGAHAGCDT